MKILLTAINAKYIHSNLAVRYLKAFTKDLNYECIIKEFSINDRRERIVEEIIKEKPNLVAFSCYIWNIDLVIQIANIIKVIDENIEILYGGPEVSFDSEDFLNNNPGEYVIAGEGEESFREFVKWKLNSTRDDKIIGLVKMSLSDKKNHKDNIGGFPNRDLFKELSTKRELLNMNKLVFPYEDDYNINDKIVYYEASRGCPFNCKYCLSSTINGVRFIDVERVKRELQFFMDRKVPLVKFVDRTFNCNNEFTKAIWRFLIDAKTETRFHFEISADLLREDEIELLKKTPEGRFQFEIGVQSTNEAVLQNINRKAGFQDIKEKILKIKEIKGLKKHLDLIAGLPGENLESFKNSFNEVYSLQPEEIQLGFLKLLKGSPLRCESLKWGISFSPYAPYEILKSKDISYSELIKLKAVEEMVDKYYNSGKFNTVLKYFHNIFSEPFSFYENLSDFFYSKGYFGRSISNVDYYKVFLEFNEEALKKDNFYLREIIKYDYLSFNKRKWLPDFLCRDWDKATEHELKKRIVIEYDGVDLNKIHIEKFKVDVLTFVLTNKFIEKSCYLLFFSEWEKSQDITTLLAE